MKEVNVGLIGLGTVGTATAKILIDNKVLLEDRCGFNINLSKVCVRDSGKERCVEPGILTTSVDDIVNDPSINIVVELVGGIEPAKSFVMKALEKNKHVVTANKALLAEHGEEIFGAAEAQGLDIGFEASVAGGIPVIRTIKEGLVGNNIKSLYGIINGTSNYILTNMSAKGESFENVLKQAQKLGYAEADPTYDIDGNDAAQKLAILATLSFGRVVSPSEIFTSGITDIEAVDFKYAEEFCYKIKLLAILKRSGNEIEVRVHPTMISQKHMLANVDGVYNAVFVEANEVGTAMYYGEGAGGMATASAVVSDIVDISRDLVGGISKRVPCMNYVSNVHKDVLSIKDINEVISEYYLRFTVVDHPGVLAGITEVMAEQNISVASIIQKRSETGDDTSIVLMTHFAQEKDVRDAVKKVEALSDVASGTVIIRVENM